ncbi:MAG TPA: hypothetical protein VKY65_14625 [Alphaproteobacteria bacterium]|nr:hypothetical protein [Alphaproteobacteria bacterium]
MKPLTITARMAERQGLPCNIAGCPARRHGVSNYCTRHKLSLLRNGSPTQRAIRKYEYAPDLKTVRRFVRRNAKHPTFVATFAELDRQLSEAAAWATEWRGYRPRSWRQRLFLELARLATHGVTGRNVFEAAAAVFLFSRRRPGALDPYGRPLHYAIARAVFSLAPRYRTPSTRRRDGALRTITKRLSSEVLDEYGSRLTRFLLPALAQLARTLERNSSTGNQSTCVIPSPSPQPLSG